MIIYLSHPMLYLFPLSLSLALHIGKVTLEYMIQNIVFTKYHRLFASYRVHDIKETMILGASSLYATFSKHLEKLLSTIKLGKIIFNINGSNSLNFGIQKKSKNFIVNAGI